MRRPPSSAAADALTVDAARECERFRLNVVIGLNARPHTEWEVVVTR